MGDLLPIPFTTQSPHEESGAVSSERLVNCYLTPNPPNSESPYTIRGIPGLKAWGTYGTGPCRGAIYAAKLGRIFLVSGTELYVISSDGSSTMIGVVPGGGPVAMCANYTHVAIATTLGLYVATAAAISNVDGNHYTSATYQDGYAIYTLAGGEQFYISGLDDLTTVNPLDFSSADTLADDAVGCISDHRGLIVFGTETIESYGDTGNSLFPFERLAGGFIENGCAAAGSIAKRDRRVFWLDNECAVRVMEGHQTRRISTPGLERTIRGLLKPEEARAMVYAQEGHDFYCLNFSDASYTYDLTTGLWHDRETYGKPRWRAEAYVRAWGKDLVADFETGDIWELDPLTYTDGALPLVRTIYSPQVHGGGKLVIADELYLDCETGVGLTSGQGVDPQLMLSWSDDGGHTYSNQLDGALGALGSHQTRVRWTQLGSFYERTFRISLSDPVKLCVLGAYGRWDTCST